MRLHTPALWVVGVALLVGVAGAAGQGTFQNLNFEKANVPGVPPLQFGSDLLTTNGVPGWTVYLGGIQQTWMAHNSVSLGGALLTILGPQWFPSQILEGSYTVSLQRSMAGPLVTAGIGQTGQIPSAAESIRFYGQANGDYAVAFGGQSIPLVALGSGPNYTIFGGDVSAFANQTAELLFQGTGLVDAIQFSNLRIPEPNIFGLSALGALLLGWRGLGRRR
jgi:hypothetical protein